MKKLMLLVLFSIFVLNAGCTNQRILLWPLPVVSDWVAQDSIKVVCEVRQADGEPRVYIKRLSDGAFFEATANRRIPTDSIIEIIEVHYNFGQYRVNHDWTVKLVAICRSLN